MQELIDKFNRLLLLKHKYRRKAVQADAMQSMTLAQIFKRDPDFFRRQRGSKTQRELADAAGVQQSYVSQFEAGKFDMMSDDAILSLLKEYARGTGRSDGLRETSGVEDDARSGGPKLGGHSVPPGADDVRSSD